MPPPPPNYTREQIVHLRSLRNRLRSAKYNWEIRQLLRNTATATGLKLMQLVEWQDREDGRKNLLHWLVDEGAEKPTLMLIQEFWARSAPYQRQILRLLPVPYAYIDSPLDGESGDYTVEQLAEVRKCEQLLDMIARFMELYRGHLSSSPSSEEAEIMEAAEGEELEGEGGEGEVGEEGGGEEVETEGQRRQRRTETTTAVEGERRIETAAEKRKRGRTEALKTAEDEAIRRARETAVERERKIRVKEEERQAKQAKQRRLGMERMSTPVLMTTPTLASDPLAGVTAEANFSPVRPLSTKAPSRVVAGRASFASGSGFGSDNFVIASDPLSPGVASSPVNEDPDPDVEMADIDNSLPIPHDPILLPSAGGDGAGGQQHRPSTPPPPVVEVPSSPPPVPGAPDSPVWYSASSGFEQMEKDEPAGGPKGPAWEAEQVQRARVSWRRYRHYP